MTTSLPCNKSADSYKQPQTRVPSHENPVTCLIINLYDPSAQTAFMPLTCACEAMCLDDHIPTMQLKTARSVIVIKRVGNIYTVYVYVTTCDVDCAHVSCVHVFTCGDHTGNRPTVWSWSETRSLLLKVCICLGVTTLLGV